MVMEEEKKKRKDTKKKKNREEKKLSLSALFFLLSIMGHRGEDKDKYSQPEPQQRARRMTLLDSGAAFHYLTKFIHSLPLDGFGSYKHSIIPLHCIVAGWWDQGRTTRVR